MAELVAALSFTGKDAHRMLVRAVADGLAEIYERDAIFFDEWYRAELSRNDGAHLLEQKYRSAKLMVVFLSPDYGQMRNEQWWTRLEWDEAFQRHVQRQNERLHLFRIDLNPKKLDALDLPGLRNTSFTTSVEGRSTEVLVGDIVYRLDQLNVQRDKGPDRTAPQVVREAYRRTALERHGRVSMIGVHLADLELSMDEIYVPLRFHREAPEVRIGGKAVKLEGGDDYELGIEGVFRFVKSDQVPTVMGEAGSGKTTALKKLLHGVLTRPPEQIQLPPHTLPHFVRAAELKRTFETSSEDGSTGSRQDWRDGPLGELVAQSWTAEQRSVLMANKRPLLLLLDGLDELADPKMRLRTLRLIDQAITTDPNLRAVVSCRHSARGYEIDFPARFKRFAVQPLNDAQRRQLTQRWFTAAFHELGETDPKPRAKEETKALFERLGDVYRLDPHHRTLLSAPLFATLQCVIHLAPDKELPKDSVTFLKAALELLLDRREKHGAEEKPPEARADTLTRVLEDVALRIQEEQRQDGLTRDEWTKWVWDAVETEIPERKEDLWKAWLERHLKAEPHRIDRATVRWLHTDADILTELGRDELIFRHRGFQEMLAAARLVDQGRTGLDTLAKQADGQTWREPFLYAAQMLGPKGFNALARRLVQRPDWHELHDLLQDTLSLLGTVSPAPFVESLKRGTDAERQVVLDLFGERDNAELREAAAAALTSVTNPGLRTKLEKFVGHVTTSTRLTPGTAFVERTTGMRFLFVPGGTFQMGADDIGEAERPVHSVRVSPFWLAETMVTNKQYRPFVEATGREPQHWNDRRFNQDKQPVVGVTWHNAVAYCTWLTEQLTEQIEAVARLPSEAWWERVARGNGNRRYPWGNQEPDESRAWFDQEIGVPPKPVGQYPAGAGPYGHLDLAGNAWEWCQDLWDAAAYAQPPHSVHDPIDPERKKGNGDVRCVRGGSCWSVADGLQAAFRGGVDAGLWGGDQGFRICLAPPSTMGSGGKAP